VLAGRERRVLFAATFDGLQDRRKIDLRALQELFVNNRWWAAEMVEHEPAFFADLTAQKEIFPSGRPMMRDEI
jgi:hypothetical protein